MFTFQGAGLSVCFVPYGSYFRREKEKSQPLFENFPHVILHKIKGGYFWDFGHFDELKGGTSGNKILRSKNTKSTKVKI